MSAALLKSSIERLRRLHRRLGELEGAAELLELAPLAGREWFELLERKLLPQLHDDAFLVVAVVGGTNIGKSVVFNQLAGAKTSATSPLASGTKHPVCLVPTGFENGHDLEAIFSGFRVRAWSRSDESLEERDEHTLFWTNGERLPANLLLLDTPDVDSDAEVNWERADHVRRAADVLLAVLTQQKYNDAAVKRFFRAAAEEDKAVVVVFNQCHLPDDEPYVPLWLNTFCDETGVRPEFVYVVPHDRRAAEDGRLPFHEAGEAFLAAPPDVSDEPPSASRLNADSRDLVEDLSRLRFDEIKFRTLRGSLQRVLDEESGTPAYLREIRARSIEYAAAADRLRSEGLVERRDWPAPPKSALKAAIEHWWRTRQSGVEVFVRDVYSGLAALPSWLYRGAARLAGSEPEELTPLQRYARDEWEAIVGAVEQLYGALERTARDRNDLLRRRLDPILGGKTREALLERLRREQEATNFERELQRVVDEELTRLEERHPDRFRLRKLLKSVGTYARPVTSVVLFGVGFGPMGEVLMPALTDAAAGAAATAAGEAVFESSTRMGELFGGFPRLVHDRFVVSRLQWLEGMLNEHLLDSLPADLHRAATITEAESFREVSSELDGLRATFTGTEAEIASRVAS